MFEGRVIGWDSSDDGWKLRVALPGIDPKDVHIDLHGNSLTISGERTRTERSGQGHTSEFTLPANVDADHVVADYDHGMLELPLAEATRPRRIAIGTGSNKRIERAA